MVAGLTGGILFANVAVESAAPVSPVIAVSRRVLSDRSGRNGPALQLNRGFGSGHLARRGSSFGDAHRTGDDWRTDRPSDRAASRQDTFLKRRRPGKVKGVGRVRSASRASPRPAMTRDTTCRRDRGWPSPATKKKDALTIGAPAAGGAVIGESWRKEGRRNRCARRRRRRDRGGVVHARRTCASDAERPWR
jgi:hypothetical protein